MFNTLVLFEIIGVIRRCLLLPDTLITSVYGHIYRYIPEVTCYPCIAQLIQTPHRFSKLFSHMSVRDIF